MRKRVSSVARGVLSFALVVTSVGCVYDEMIEASSSERTDTPSVEFHNDGAVTVGEVRYADVVDFQLSDEFQENGRRCGTKEEPSEFLEFAPSDCSFKNTLIDDDYSPENGDVLQVSVVFHVIERSDGKGHIPLELIQSQIEILNEDYRALAETPGSEGVDAKIQFVLANEDESGNPTTGVQYRVSNSWFSDPGTGPSPMKSALGWDPNRYFNIYTNDANGALGYATFPSKTAGKSDDGVVLLWSSVGRDAPDGGVYNQGRTLTHEAGHYFGLFHTFQGGCGSDDSPYTTGDLIKDTTAHSSPDFKCNAKASTCDGADDSPIENYMNYTNDTCMTGFSFEQSNRMRCSTLQYRPELFRVANGSNKAPSPSFKSQVTESQVSFSDTSSDKDGNIVGWFWDFGDGSYSSKQNPTHDYAEAGKYQVSLLVQDDKGGTSVSTFEVDVVVGSGNS